MLIERNGVLGVECDGRFIPAIAGGTGIEIAALAVTAIGAAVSAYGAYSQAQSQQTALKTQAKMHEADAAMSEAAGREAAARQRKRDSYKLGSFGAEAGKMGVIAREGSALLSELDFATQSELEAQHQQYGYQVQAARAQTQANFAKWQASRIDPLRSAGLSLFGSATSIAGSYVGAPAKAQTGGGLNVSTMRGRAGEDF